RRKTSSGCRCSPVQQKATWRTSLSRDVSQPRVVEDPGMRTRLLHGNREISIAASVVGASLGRPGPWPTMNAMERSDSSKVVKKQANKAALGAAEPVERRDGAKENADLQTTVRTQSREAVSQAQGRIRVAVTRNRREKLKVTTLADVQALMSHLTEG